MEPSSTRAARALQCCLVISVASPGHGGDRRAFSPMNGSDTFLNALEVSLICKLSVCSHVMMIACEV